MKTVEKTIVRWGFEPDGVPVCFVYIPIIRSGIAMQGIDFEHESGNSSFFSVQIEFVDVSSKGRKTPCNFSLSDLDIITGLLASKTHDVSLFNGKFKVNSELMSGTPFTDQAILFLKHIMNVFQVHDISKGVYPRVIREETRVFPNPDIPEFISFGRHLAQKHGIDHLFSPFV